ncbi:MAG: hypothetical protein K2W96_08515 [Gemmataceae bacterium]|nr:hypothetical protein [Gemmataceae bacterium]
MAALLLLASLLPAAGEKPPVYVILWFDTEDYILPASDDAALWLADFLTKEGIRGTFKVVGEKARTLEKRKRKDVIDALKKHEIGYHSDFHSVHPTPAQYLSNLGWDEGVAEFVRREEKGWKDVERVFGQKPTCYGQPGSSWGPQSYGALRKWGMHYLDSGRHVAFDGKPCYYAGVFNLYQLAHYTRADLNKPEELEKATTKFAEMRERIHKEGGGVVSIVYHPCEWVHKQFWDGVNFSKGANPPREKWKEPPQKTEEETKRAKRVFIDYIAFMKRFKDVKFITCSEAAALYADKAAGKSFDKKEIRKVAELAAKSADWQDHGGYALTASEAFALLVEYAEKRNDVKLGPTPLGPTSRIAEMKEAVRTDRSQFTRTVADVASYLRKHGRMPGTVWLGSTGVPPAAFHRAMGKAVLALLDKGEVPEEIALEPAALVAEKHVSADDPKLWGWVIFPPGMKAPAMMDLAKRQAWALKPALLGK